MLHDQIDKDYIAAMKAKDKLKSATLNFLRAQLKNVVIEKRVDKLEDSDVVTVRAPVAAKGCPIAIDPP